MVEFLRRVLAPSRPGIPPILVRLRTPGEGSAARYVEGLVHVEAEWGSYGAPERWSTRASQGLCIIPWQRGRQVRLRFQHGAGHGQVELTHQQVREGSAAEIFLTS